MYIDIRNSISYNETTPQYLVVDFANGRYAPQNKEIIGITEREAYELL